MALEQRLTGKQRYAFSSFEFSKSWYRQMQAEKKINSHGYNTVHNVKKAKEIVTFFLVSTCHSFPLSDKKTPYLKSSWLYNRDIKQNKIPFGTARGLPGSLNRGGHCMNRGCYIMYSSQFSETLTAFRQIKIGRLRRDFT